MPTLFDQLRTIATQEGVDNVFVSAFCFTQCRVDLEWVGTPREKASVNIDVVVQLGRQHEPNDHEDAILLAHEIGHARRYRRNEEDPEYREKCSQDSNIENKHEAWKNEPEVFRCKVMIEENAAWEYACKFLTEVGFTDWEMFREMRRKATDGYRNGLNLGSIEAHTPH